MHLPYAAKKLDIRFDAARLAAEVAAIPEEDWVFHGFHNTGHKVLPLYSSNGSLTNEDGSYNHSLIPPFLPTPYLDRLPALAEALASFGAQPFRTRLAQLPPGTIINPHRDLHPNWYDKVRLHIPIVTHESVKLHTWNDRPTLAADDLASWHMAPGEAWVFNIWHVHAVTNLSPVTRIHLVADFRPEGRLFDLMFRDCTKAEIVSCMSHAYPGSYQTDLDTLTWLSGGKPEIGRRLWNVDVQERNPQVGGYKHPERFWDPAAYERTLAPA